MGTKILCLILLIGLQCWLIKKTVKTSNFVIIYMLILWVLVLCWFTLHGRKSIETRDVYIIPVKSYADIIQNGWSGSGKYIVREVIGNVVLFLPLGLLYGFKANRKSKWQGWLLLLAGAAVSIGIESIQYTYKLGVFETDDIIHNVWGTVIGITMADNLKKAKGKNVPLLMFILLVGISSAVSIFCN